MKSGLPPCGPLRAPAQFALKQTGASFFVLVCFLYLFGLCAAQPGTTSTLPQQGEDGNLINPSGPWNPPVKEIKDTKVKYGKSPVSKSGGSSLLIDVTPGSPVDYYSLDQKVGPVAPGDIYRLTGWIKTEEARGGAGAYLSINAFEARNPEKRLTYSDSNRVIGTQGWTQAECVLLVPPGAKEIRAFVLLNGIGRAYFSNARLQLLSKSSLEPPKKVRISVTKQVIRGDFMGFGFEDDPFFYTSSNYKNGVDEADIVLRERRIQALKPAIVRSFLYWPAFNPAQDLETFDFETEFMRSVYRTLDLYQKMNVPVNICGAYWDWPKDEFPFSDRNVEKGVAAYVKVLKHLIQTKGYSCVKYVTINNEPDISWEDQGGTFASFVKAHQLLKEALAKAGLGSLILVGGDIAEDYRWMKETIAQADDCFGIYSLHKYLNITQYPLIGYYLDKASGLLAKYSKTHAGLPGKPGKPGPLKPLFLWEFGYLGDFYAANINDEMKNYRYGLLCANTYMGVMNHSFSGASIWCLQSLHYLNHTEDKMQFGLWEYKEKGWRTRPVYYASALFSALYQKGMNPVKVVQEPRTSQFCSAAMSGPGGNLTIYLLNLSAQAVRARLANLPAQDYDIYQYSQDRLPAAGSENYEKADALKKEQRWNSAAGEIEVAPQSLLVLKCFDHHKD